MPGTNQNPHYSLELIKQLIESGDRFVTKQATLDASYIGFTKEDIYQVILDLKASDFYKTMEAENNPLLWHDVYHYKHDEADVTLYIKLQIKKNAVVISFKEK